MCMKCFLCTYQQNIETLHVTENYDGMASLCEKCQSLQKASQMYVTLTVILVLISVVGYTKNCYFLENMHKID